MGAQNRPGNRRSLQGLLHRPVVATDAGLGVVRGAQRGELHDVSDAAALRRLERRNLNLPKPRLIAGEEKQARRPGERVLGLPRVCQIGSERADVRRASCGFGTMVNGACISPCFGQQPNKLGTDGAGTAGYDDQGVSASTAWGIPRVRLTLGQGEYSTGEPEARYAAPGDDHNHDASRRAGVRVQLTT
jgi:hypothetical protein